MSRCSICHTLIQTADETRACPSCELTYHAPCWDGIGGCATYGCRAAAVAEKPPAPVAVGRGWGDEKECPGCFAQIPASLLQCRCGARFPYADPMTNEEYRAWLADQAAQRAGRRNLVLMFAGSLLAVPAPLLGPLAAIYAHRRRGQMSGENGSFVALGYGVGAMGAAYTLMLLLLVLGK